MPKYIMVIDSSVCINCRACLVACQQENQVPYESFRIWVKQGADETAPSGLHYQPGNCMHCDNPVCVHACPTGATYKDPADGIVKVDTELCIGCGSCVKACPYGARFKDPVRNVVDKCNYCPRRREMGLDPACVAICPTKTRVFGDADDPNSEVSKLLKEKKTVQIIAPSEDTKPAIYYIDRTAPMDWPKATSSPTPIRLMRSVLSPVTTIVGGLTLLGIAGVAVKNLITGGGEDHHEEAHHD